MSAARRASVAHNLASLPLVRAPVAAGRMGMGVHYAKMKYGGIGRDEEEEAGLLARAIEPANERHNIAIT